MRKILAIAFVCVLTNFSAQTPTQKSYSGTTNDVAKAFFETYDNGFLLGGQTGNWASVVKDVFLLKTDENGDTLWSKTYGGSNDDEFKDLKETSDSGAVFIGTTNSFGLSNKDIYVTKVDVSGDVEWSKTYGGANDDVCNSIIQTTTNNFVLVGSSYNTITSTTDLLVVKLNINGDTLWSKLYGGIVANSNLSGKKIIETADNSYAVLSFFENGGSLSSVITKIDTNGNELWSKVYFSGTFSSVIFNSFKETSNGGYVLGGFDDLTFSMVIMKIDASGVLDWAKNMGQATPSVDSNWVSLFVTDTNVLITAGESNSSNLLFIKSDTLGNILWSNSYTRNIPLEHHEIKKLYNNQFAIVGGGLSDFSLLFLDTLGNSSCNQTALVINPAPFVVQNTASTFQNISAFLPVVNNAPTIVGTKNFQVDAPCFVAQEICMVTTDSLLKKNKIVWEKQTPSTVVKQYNIYRESAVLNIYNLIGSVSSDSLSEFIDSTSNPLQNPYRYKISQTNQNNFVSDFGAPHKTIHLTISLGVPSTTINLNWNAYEGVTYNTYNIWRGTGTQLSLLASVNSSIQSYTDLSPTIADSIYIIEIVPTTGSCISTARQTTFTSIISNKSSSNGLLTGVAEDIIKNGIKIHPNPVRDILTVEIPVELANSFIQIDIFNLLGENVSSKAKSLNGENSCKVDFSSLNKGMYLLTITSENKQYSYKILKSE